MVLLDLGLSDVGGFEVLRGIRAREVTTPVVTMTAQNVARLRDRALGGGANGFVDKPFTPVGLLACISASQRRDAA